MPAISQPRRLTRLCPASRSRSGRNSKH
jgi:hypothetical protein